jgi:hypothetical protein
MFWAIARVIPVFSPAEVVSTMWPHMLNLLILYPQAIVLAWDSQVADAGLPGGLAVRLWSVILLPPSLAGIWLGLPTWPEVFVFRIFLRTRATKSPLITRYTPCGCTRAVATKTRRQACS